jgi:predicted transcriptional regulator
MGSTIQARLDKDTAKALGELVRRLGWSPSRVVREAVRLLAVTRLGVRRQRIIGLGEFASGIKDLGSNKDHMRGFGR